MENIGIPIRPQDTEKKGTRRDFQAAEMTLAAAEMTLAAAEIALAAAEIL